MKTMRVLSTVALAVIITACCACRGNKNAIPLTDVEWRLTQLGGENVTAGEKFRMTLASDGKISGVGDCNRYNGTFTRTAGSNRTSGGLKVGGNLVATRMMCPDQARETAFLKMLTDIESWSIDGERLMLLKGGDVLAIFEPYPVTAD
jgi:heat shock protein HslJ